MATRVNVTYQESLASVQLASQSRRLLPTVFATMNWTRKFNKTTKNKHYLSDRSRSLDLAAVPSSRSGGAEMPTHKIVSGKANHSAGFRNATLAGNILRKIAQLERWTR